MVLFGLDTEICGANVILNKTTGGICLIDVEDLYSPTLRPPQALPHGQAGYAHKSGQHQWQQYGDRFAAAILVSEMLGWSQVKIRQEAYGETFFDPHELQLKGTLRYNLMYYYLKSLDNKDLADYFETAWNSDKFEDCPPIQIWKSGLEKCFQSLAQTRPERLIDPEADKTIRRIQVSTYPSIPINSGSNATPPHQNSITDQGNPFIKRTTTTRTSSVNQERPPSNNNPFPRNSSVNPFVAHEKLNSNASYSDENLPVQPVSPLITDPSKPSPNTIGGTLLGIAATPFLPFIRIYEKLSSLKNSKEDKPEVSIEPVRRFIDIDCPKKLRLGQSALLIVNLTLEEVLSSRTAGWGEEGTVIVHKLDPIEVNIQTSEGLEILTDLVQIIKLYPNQNSDPVRFKLKAIEEGEQKLSLSFWQGNKLAQRLEIDVQVLAIEPLVTNYIEPASPANMNMLSAPPASGPMVMSIAGNAVPAP